jgi:hypothetical protein
MSRIELELQKLAALSGQTRDRRGKQSFTRPSKLSRGRLTRRS